MRWICDPGWRAGETSEALKTDRSQGRISFRFRQPQRLLRAPGDPRASNSAPARKFDYVPILLGGVFKLTNNQPPMIAVQGRQEQTRIPEAGDRALHQEARADRVPDEPAFPRQYRADHARRGRGRLQAPPFSATSRSSLSHVGGGKEDGRCRGDPRHPRRRRSRRSSARWRESRSRASRTRCSRTPRARLPAAPSARPPSTSGMRFFSARTASAPSRSRSRSHARLRPRPVPRLRHIWS